MVYVGNVHPPRTPFFFETIRYSLSSYDVTKVLSSALEWKMYNQLYSIAKKIWPELEGMGKQRQLVGVGDVIISFGMAPIVVIGLYWLITLTDLDLVRFTWQNFILFAVLLFIFNRVSYFFIIEIRADRYGSADGSLASMIQWTAVFLLGPTALWLSVIGISFSFVWNIRKAGSTSARWDRLRGSLMELAIATLAYLVALAFYRQWGGVYPIPGLSPRSVMIALGALIVHFLMVILIWAGYTTYAIWLQRELTQSANIKPIIRFLVLVLGLPALAYPFAILLAGLYVQNGFFVFIFFVIGLLLVAYLARQLSWAAESSRQQSRQLEELEHLSRDIIISPPDASMLPDLLEKHVLNMFPSGRIIIWLSPDQFILRSPSDWSLDIDPIWQWVKTQSGCSDYLPKNSLPWGGQLGGHEPLVVSPIVDAVTAQAIGCVYIELRSLAQPWDKRALTSLFPAVRTLAAQVASALHQAETYRDTLDYRAAIQELEFAGRIQSSFMPKELPSLDGWELAVTLLPARETSGDFFDFFQLSDGRTGILIADVTDKGLGAALYMALSRTLIRTYALEYDEQPDIVFFSANERILQDAHADLFVTAFYGILDQSTGELTYANAGHNPPFLLSLKDGGTIHAMTTTGMPIGIDEDASWTQTTTQINPGDVLILYTDGIPDAQNSEGAFFKERQLIEVVQRNLGASANQIQTSILEEVEKFVGDAPQFDDITLLVIARYGEQDTMKYA